MNNKKLSSYQRQKIKIEALERDIYNLVMKRNELSGISVDMRYKMQYGMENAALSGSGIVENVAAGILAPARLFNT